MCIVQSDQMRSYSVSCFSLKRRRLEYTGSDRAASVGGSGDPTKAGRVGLRPGQCERVGRGGTHRARVLAVQGGAC